MNQILQQGGCQCGQVRYSTSETPVRSMACHCSGCKKRTGSAFGIGIYFNDNEVDFSGIERGSYQFESDTTGRWIRNEFCPQCATTVSWTLEMRPGLRAIAGGTYDDPRWFTLESHIWTRSACNAILYPEDVGVFEKALPG